LAQGERHRDTEQGPDGYGLRAANPFGVTFDNWAIVDMA
jgi:hypothetical protein